MRYAPGWLLAFLLSAAPAAAGPSATLTGVARDASGTPLAQVVVALSSSAANVIRQTATDADGRYVFADLPVASDYFIVAVHSSFRRFERTRLTLRDNERLELDITLSLAAAERVEVPAPEPAGTASAPRQPIDETLTRDLPLYDRGFIQLSMLAPGFTGHPDYPDSQGQFYWMSNILVDGASDYSKWRGAARSFYSGYGRESIRRVDVLSNLFAATVGDSLASVTMATTRAGGEAWHGSAFVFARDEALAATPVFAIAKPASGSQQYGASIGGPFRDSRFHLFASYEARRSRDHNIVSAPAARGVAVASDQDERIGFARVDGQLSDTQSFTARLNSQRFRWADQPGALTLPGSGTRYTNDAHTVLATHRALVSSAVTSEAQVEFARYTDLRTDLQPGLFVSRAGYSISGGSLGPAGLGVDPENTWEAHETLVRAGRVHTTRAGGTVRSVRAHATTSQYERGAYFFAGGPTDYPEPFLFVQSVAPQATPATVDPHSVAAAAYFQDEWRAARDVTLNLGVRYDVERLSNIRNVTAHADTNNVQPRFGLEWRPAGGQTLVRAAAGLYSQQHVLYPIDEVQLEGIGGLATMAIAPESAAFPVFPATLRPGDALVAAPRDIYRLDPNFRNPYSVQAGGGVERPLGGFTLSADYLFLNGYDLVSIVDANAPASIVKPAQRPVATADATRPLTPVPSGYRKVLTIGNAGRSWYRALQVRANGRAASLHGVAAYTLARAEDEANYLLPEDSNDLAAERGRAATDVRHSLAGALTWQLPGSRALTRGWSVAGVGVFRSNRPYTITWGDDRNGTTQYDARPGARNTGRTGAYRVIDVSVSRRESLGAAALEARLEVFNLLDATNYDEYVGTLLSPLFARPISAFPPRRAQLALTLRF